MRKTKHLFALLAIPFALLFVGCAQTKKVEIPSPTTITDLGNKATFDSATVTDRPFPQDIADKLNPNFHISTNFVSKEPVWLDQDLGAVVAKIQIDGVPKVYNLPDGTYYLWVGKEHDEYRAVMTSLNGDMQTEVLCSDEPLPLEQLLTGNRPAKAIHSTLNAAMLQLPRPPPPLPHPPPPPPQSYRMVCVEVCRPMNEKTECKWLKAAIPDN